jgi:23S rRNA pseudouridine2605 synthase
MKDADQKGERIAKRMARAGVCSRRDAERLIAEGRVTLNGKPVESPAMNVTEKDVIALDGEMIGGKEITRLWRYHKPNGLVTSHRDEQGRDTIFDHLPEDMPRVISVGRLDLNSEGLILLTNDGALSRHLELPSTGLSRRYRVRAFGEMTENKIKKLRDGILIDGVQYGSIETEIEREQGSNVWLSMTLHEGKNREIRRVLDFLGLQVNRLIRISYGAFELGDLPEGEVEEISQKQVSEIARQIVG